MHRYCGFSSALFIVSVSLMIFSQLLFPFKYQIGNLTYALYSSTFDDILKASVLISCPFLLENLQDFYGNKHFSIISKSSNISLIFSIITPNLIMLTILHLSSLDLFRVCLCFIYLQLFLTIWGILMFSRNFFQDSKSNWFSTILIFLIGVTVILSNFSHICSEFYFKLFLSLSLICACISIVGIMKLFRICSLSRSIIKDLNYSCYIVCMISLFVLVLGCILLRLISLYAVDGMSIYINGLTILSSLCSLPVFMLDGRIAKYNSSKFEV